MSIFHQACAVCKKSGRIELMDCLCPFCNGTGEHTKAADSFMKSHTCQCIIADRKNCGLCGKKCHHSSNNRPVMTIAPPAR